MGLECVKVGSIVENAMTGTNIFVFGWGYRSWIRPRPRRWGSLGRAKQLFDALGCESRGTNDRWEEELIAKSNS